MAVPDCRYEAIMRKKQTAHTEKQPVPKPARRIVAALFLALAFAGACLNRPTIALAASAPAAPRVAHVVVALCDNLNQGIVPVPAGIGNGQNPATNLYWGAGYGIKTFLSRQEEWTLVSRQPGPTPQVLERLVFELKGRNLYLVADAWDGKEIKPAIAAFLDYAAGAREETVALEPAAGRPAKLRAGGQSGLVVYVGHNGLMDFSLDSFPQSAGTGKRDAAVFACLSQDYFLEALQQAGARPLILTRSLMCPEASSTHALVLGWAGGEAPVALWERIAAAYSRYQKCSLKAARSVFAAEE